MSSFPTTSTISAACKCLKFSVPPASKKILKQRFLELAKETHPDRARAKGLNVNQATRKMAQLTEAYKTLQTVVAAGGMGGMVNNGTFIRNNTSSNTGAQSQQQQTTDSASCSFGHNISNPTEYEESPEDLAARRRDSFERTWLPWQKMRRESCEKARPLDDDTVYYRYIFGQRVPSISIKVMLMRFWKNFVPMRQRQLMLNAGTVMQEKSVKMIKAAKFVVTGRS